MSEKLSCAQKCSARQPDGQACGTWPVTDCEYWYRHDPDSEKKREAAPRDEPQPPGAAYQSATGPTKTEHDLETESHRQEFMALIAGNKALHAMDVDPESDARGGLPRHHSRDIGAAHLLAEVPVLRAR